MPSTNTERQRQYRARALKDPDGLLLTRLQVMLSPRADGALQRIVAAKGFNGQSDEFLDQEIIGDILGDSFDDPSFWAQVADQSPSKFRKIAVRIRQWITNIIGKFQGLASLGSEEFITDLKKAKTELAKLTVKSLSESGRKEIANIAKGVQDANSTGLHSTRLSKSIQRLHSESPRTLTDSERSDKRNELEESGFYDGFGKGKSGLLLQPENGEVGHTPQDNRGLPTRVERKENFWKWFGGSLTTIDGTPMVFWQKSKTFGQKGEESWKFKDEFLGSNLPHPRTQFGPTFTPLKAQAEHYSGTNRGYYLRIENPLVIPYSKTENRFKNQDEAIAFANRMENLEGYDSIIIPEMQFIHIFDSNQAKLIDNSGEFGKTRLALESVR